MGYSNKRSKTTGFRVDSHNTDFVLNQRGVVMIRLYKHQYFFLLIMLLLIICLAAPFRSNAEENPSTLSGRVINADGEPVTDIPLVLIYVKIRDNGQVDPLYHEIHYPFLPKRFANLPREVRERIPIDNEEPKSTPFQKSQTDSEGKFTIAQISSGLAQLMVLPPESKETDPNKKDLTRFPEIQAIRFGNISFYPFEFTPSSVTGGVTFAVNPGANIQNVEVILKPQLKKILPKDMYEIRGSIVFRDGKPLANTSLNMDVGFFGFGNTNGYANNVTVQTDEDGNFVHKVAYTAIYVLSVEHLGLSFTSEPFVLNSEIPQKQLEMKLNGNSSELAEPSPDDEKSAKPRRTSTHAIPRIWVVNPENGHAYKVIQCKNREDAHNQAEAEGAHLVTITSESEQVWLDVVFKEQSSWLGLVYVPLASEWLWETGEPLTYTNWTLDDEMEHRVPNIPGNVPGFERHYAILSRKGDWNAVGLRGPVEGRSPTAIIERDGFQAKKLDNIK